MSIEDSIVFLKPGYVTLKDWNIVIIHKPNQETSEIFVGFSVSDNMGRLSTPIQKYNDKTGEGETWSGSRYQTIGKPGMPHDDAVYVLESLVGKATVTKELFNSASDAALSFKYAI